MLEHRGWHCILAGRRKSNETPRESASGSGAEPDGPLIINLDPTLIEAGPEKEGWPGLAPDRPYDGRLGRHPAPARGTAAGSGRLTGERDSMRAALSFLRHLLAKPVSACAKKVASAASDSANPRSDPWSSARGHSPYPSELPRYLRALVSDPG